MQREVRALDYLTAAVLGENTVVLPTPLVLDSETKMNFLTSAFVTTYFALLAPLMALQVLGRTSGDFFTCLVHEYHCDAAALAPEMLENETVVEDNLPLTFAMPEIFKPAVAAGLVALFF